MFQSTPAVVWPPKATVKYEAFFVLSFFLLLFQFSSRKRLEDGLYRSFCLQARTLRSVDPNIGKKWASSINFIADGLLQLNMVPHPNPFFWTKFELSRNILGAYFSACVWEILITFWLLLHWFWITNWNSSALYVTVLWKMFFNI